MKSYTEIIDKYLSNELSATERKSFEEELETNEELKKQFEVQKEIMKGIQQQGLRTDIIKAVKKVKLNKLIKTAVVLTLTVAIAVLGTYYMKKNVFSKPNNHVQYELNEQGSTNWSEADKNLESQIFKIDPTKDTIIETEKGIIFQIKAGTFLNKFGETQKEPFDLEVKEAMTGYDIMKAGLSTTSNGELLETGGMFYINARNRKEVLDIDQGKAIKVHVPSGSDKKMNLFDGERLKDGSINWIAPKPMKKQLSTVDILSLDFYPPNFIDSVKGMGFDVKNKTLTDSIYYSFYCSEGATLIDDYSNKDTIVGLTDFSVVANIDTLKSISKPDGEKLFRQNCSQCHTAHDHKKLTGPGLKGIFDRAPKGDWLRGYILNNEKLIKAGDPYANKIFEEYNHAAMTVFEGALSENEVDAILEYVAKGNRINYQSGNADMCEIEPSRIRAIWDKKFNGTILATKQFEERLKIIFSTCNAGVFNLYAQNLGSELWELDSIAATMLSGDQREKFIEFYKRQEGGVNISDAQSKKLQNYMEEKKKVYDKAVSDAMTKLYTNENKKSQEAILKRNDHESEKFGRETKILFEEIDKNMVEAYRQLGKTKPKVRFVNNYLTSEIIEPGWKNVDYYVLESTINRTTLNYTDKETGKKAVIEYKEASVEIEDYKSFDRVICYLLPEQLSSFQLMKNKENVFSEKLNMTFKYSIIVVGYKGNETYFYDVKNAKPEKYSAKMKKIDAGSLIGRINSRYNLAGTHDIIKDIDFSLFEQKEIARTNKIKKREEIRNRLMRVIFPCYTIPPAQPKETTNITEME